VYKKNPDGNLESVKTGQEGCGINTVETSELGDSVVKRLISIGACGGDKDGIVQGKKLSAKDLEQLGLLSEIGTIEGADTTVTIKMAGGSDHIVFLAEGVPAFWLKQEGDTTVMYPAHTKNDTFDRVIPEYLEHSATVMALGALGTANLDHMLSREKLIKPKPIEEASLAVPGKTGTP
jgi:hypothetical protein